jgi:hypothetical protein
MVGHIANNCLDAIMESLVGYGSDEESGETYQYNKVSVVKRCIFYVLICIELFKIINEVPRLQLI